MHAPRRPPPSRLARSTSTASRRTSGLSLTMRLPLPAAWAAQLGSSTSTWTKAPWSPSTSSPAAPALTQPAPEPPSAACTLTDFFIALTRDGPGQQRSPSTLLHTRSVSQGTSKLVALDTPRNGTAGPGGKLRCNGCRGAGSNVVDAAPPRPRSCSGSATGPTTPAIPVALVEATIVQLLLSCERARLTLTTRKHPDLLFTNYGPLEGTP